MAPELAQALASKGMARTGRSRVRNRVNRIVSLLFVFRIGDGVIGALCRGLVGGWPGALLDLRLVLIDDTPVMQP